MPPPPPPSPSPGLDPEHGSDEDRCKLLGTTGLVVQALMGVFVILSLVVKRQLERRKRSWRIWMYDVSKQLAGQAVVHGLNVLISDVVASAAHNNPCSLYFLNVLIDTTIGVAIIYFSLKAFTWYFSSYLGMEGYVSGQYGRPPKSAYWWRQLAPYLLSIMTMKLLVIFPLTLPGISKFLIDGSHSFLDHLSARAQIIFVMAIFPVVMNIVQFCLVDQVIKAGGKDDEDDDGGAAYRRVPEHDGDSGRQDVESGPRDVVDDSTRPRIRKETLPVVPSSPLLSPRVASPGYGSTSPSPVGSPDKAMSRSRLDTATGPRTATASALTPDGSIWSKIMERINDGTSSSGSSRDHSVVFDATREDGRLSVKDDRGHRSSAPSPESFRPTMAISAQLDPIQGGTSQHSHDPEVEGISRHPPEELEREARWTLSPPESPVPGHGITTGSDSVSLSDVKTR